MRAPSPIARLLVRLALMAAPLAFVVGFYVVTDPFRVVRAHASYYDESSRGYVYNRDWVSTEIFTSTYAERRYDSFIFGSSKSLAYLCRDWKERVPDARAFHFDASSESLFGIWSKLRFLDRRDVELRHVFLAVDGGLFTVTSDSDGHLFRKHPAVSGGSRLWFQWESLYAYFANGFFVKDMLAHAVPRLRRTIAAFDPRVFTQVPETNDILFTSAEDELARDEDGYYARRRDKFVPRHAGVEQAEIGPTQRAMLEEIHAILVRRHSDYRVVVNPGYDEQALNPADRRVLDEIFGADRVYDFSGANAVVDQLHNFYDSSHFRPRVGKIVIDAVYGVQSAMPRR